MSKVAIIQFPGSNTERETFIACARNNINAVEFLWNDDHNKLDQFDGYIIVGGFSYEDRSRAGVIAAQDEIIKEIIIQSESGKPVLGICNGAQILVESGMVPGLRNYDIGAALTENKRVKSGKILGQGYYNVWTNLKMNVDPARSAFTKHLQKGEIIRIPLAHGEGRFVIPETLLNEMVVNEQDLYKYCDENGSTINEFPTNPNGSINNIAAICNSAGNVMAMMPHPERTTRGDAIFSSMKKYIDDKSKPRFKTLKFKPAKLKQNKYPKDSSKIMWLIDMFITDNEAISVENALQQIGFDVRIKRQIMWEIEIEKDSKDTLEKIKKSGTLFNPNKEFIKKQTEPDLNVASILVCQKENIQGRAAYETLKSSMGIDKVLQIKHGVLWNLKINGSNFENDLERILKTNILFNQISYEYYRIK